MTVRSLPAAIRGVRRDLSRPPGTDGDHLARFVTDGDPDAFAELVRRHGPMVYAVCRRVLGNAADADDAFQATFLVLIRKAAAVRPREAVGGFLHAVAHRTALHARAASARRRAARLEGTDVPAPAPPDADLLPVLDAELAGLPEKYRTPVVLCELEGRTLKAVADQLRVPVGTVASRLARGRAMLADRLRRRGLPATAAAVSLALAGSAAARVPPGLTDTVEPTASVLALAEGVLKMMLVAKLKGIGRAAVLGLVAVVGLAAGLGGTPAAPAAAPAAAPPPKGEARSDKELDALWQELAKPETEAVRALLKLSTRKDAAAFLKGKLKPLKIDADRVKKLIVDLDSDKDETWKAAEEELVYFHPLLVMDNTAAWELATSVRHRQRLVAVLIGRMDGHDWCAFELRTPNVVEVDNLLVTHLPNAPADAFKNPRLSGYSVGLSRTVEQLNHYRWRREVRAVLVLEHLGTADAVAAITAMADGHPDAGPTKAAKEALGRLGK